MSESSHYVGQISPDAKPYSRESDIVLLVSMCVLLGFGLAAIFSVDRVLKANLFLKQTLFAAIGLGLMLIVSRIRLTSWMRVHKVLYAVSVAGLVGVLVLGKSSHSATRWIQIGPMQFQPSEVSKFFLVMTLATYFASRWERRKEIQVLLGSILHVVPIAVLLLAQPHYAGALTMFAIWAAVALAAEAPAKFMLGFLAAFVAVGIVAWTVPGLLKDYHRERILSKVVPTKEKSRDELWQQERAKIALGAGGLFGTGYLKGEQKAARYIPEQQNDFIFTVIGEELGLVGSLLLIGSFVVFFARVWWSSQTALEPMARLVASGVLGVLGFHTVVNLSMVVGLLPVAGLWLPFVSAGGTALWMCMSCVGLLRASV